MPYLLNKLPGLLDPVPAVTWSIGPLPDPLVPPLAAAPPDRTPADPLAAAAKGAAGDKKGAASSAGGKAGAGADKKQQSIGGKGGKTGVTPRADARHTLLPGTQQPHVGTALRCVKGPKLLLP